MTGSTERDEILDFPGADELVAAGAVAPPSAGTVAAVREKLALLAGPAPVSPEEPRIVIGRRAPSRAGRPSRRRFLVAGAAVAVLAAGTVAYPVLDMGSEPASTASAATVFLNEMAEVSAEAPTPHGKYWMSHYLAKDGPRGTTVRMTVYNDRSGATWVRRAKGKVGRSGQTDWAVGDRRLSWAGIDRLPTEPEKLKAHFAKRPADRFFQIMSLLSQSPASPRLRAALFQVAAETPGARLTPNAEDSQGRPGTVINIRRKEEVPKGDKRAGSPTAGTRVIVVDAPYYFIDPKTSRVLESASDLSAKPGVRTTYLKAGPTDHIG
ncbi:hypothetical protein AB0H82_16555 [Streptomyces sp. NPDC050732]|uniref:hypothetical protein n=1 Tax=Streptomyces sp. NPDC050732 TaxID=3154632 RepID=UPI00342A578B